MAENKKVALITGANKGLGLEMARQLAQKGVTVLLAARDLEKGQTAAAKPKSEGLDAEAIKLNVTDSTYYAAASRFIDGKFGRLDILINNAGIMSEDMSIPNATSTVPTSVL